jgi:poly(A) polymerase
MKDLRETATDVVRQLQSAGFTAFWVGGCVRDFVLGRTPQDYDIVTNAVPEQVEKLFPHTTPIGKKFGVVVVREEEHPFQVATFRAEADYKDGRRPSEVTFGDAQADALRRDFTVNGLFYDPIREQLHDWVAGKPDLEAKLIRTIGSPAERFGEDHLRLLRAVRLAAQLGFEIEEGTFEAIRSSAPKIRGISAERIREELCRLFQPPFAARGLDLLHQSGLLEQVLPEIEATIACEQSPEFHPEGNVFRHLMLMLDQMPPDASPSLPWAILFHDVAKPATVSTDPITGSIHFYGHEKVGADMAREILERLKFPRKQIDEIVQAVRFHMQFKDALVMRKATLRRLLMRPTFPLELELHRLDCLGSHRRLDIYDFLVAQEKELHRQPEIVPPLLTGNDLIAMGVRPGPGMGALLEELREKQLEDDLKTETEAREWVKQKLSASPPMRRDGE